MLLAYPAHSTGWHVAFQKSSTWFLAFFSLILMVVPIASVSPYRWVLLLTYPLAFCGTDALSKLKSTRWIHYKVSIQQDCNTVSRLVDSDFELRLYFHVPQHPFSYFNPAYFNGYSYEIPTSMLQNTISITDCKIPPMPYNGSKITKHSTTLLLAHTVFYSWALLTLNETQVINYGFDAPDHAALISLAGKAITIIPYLVG